MCAIIAITVKIKKLLTKIVWNSLASFSLKPEREPDFPVSSIAMLMSSELWPSVAFPRYSRAAGIDVALAGHGAGDAW
jgi:hypothetical protein